MITINIYICNDVLYVVIRFSIGVLYCVQLRNQKKMIYCVLIVRNNCTKDFFSQTVVSHEI